MNGKKIHTAKDNVETMPVINDSILPISPRGFKSYVANVGIKDKTKDFVCIFSDEPCSAAGVFTKSRFAGPCVTLSRIHITSGRARAIVAISKNANVANGLAGEADACAIVAGVAESLGVSAEEVLIASTGVIGQRYPMDRIMPHVRNLITSLTAADFMDVARGIMTTDTVPKFASVRVGDAVLTGVAKGVGMIEPNMATLLAFFVTDALIDQPLLDALFRRVMDRSFNCLSIDTDTSTSDTAVILANGLAGRVDLTAFEAALDETALDLVKAIARDGEGATKLLEVTVDQARDGSQAKRVAKAVVNSPLVKTAVHGADPNWGRVAMAIGKCDDQLDISPERTCIRFGGIEVYPHRMEEAELVRLKDMLRGEEVRIHISLGTGSARATVWGCDLSAEYVRINGEYTT
jgi:glutamate N-acetyltransferase/amino-acid N-acetyltransferase